MMGKISKSHDDSNLGSLGSSLDIGGGAVATAGSEGGRAANNMSCGIKEKVCDACVAERIDGLLFVDVGEGGGDGFGMEGGCRVTWHSEELHSRVAVLIKL